MQRADAGALALPAAAAGLLAVALLFGHGSSDSRLFWIGGATILVAVAAAISRPRLFRLRIARRAARRRAAVVDRSRPRCSLHADAPRRAHREGLPGDRAR